MQGQALRKRLNLAYGELYRPLMRIGKLQCGTIPSYNCKKKVQIGKTSTWKYQFNLMRSKRNVCSGGALAMCKSKASCALHHCPDLNLSAILGTPSRASEAHDWGNFYNSARIHLHEIRIHGRGRGLNLSPNIE